MLAIEGMTKLAIIDEMAAAHILMHIRKYMLSRRAATIRLTTACALILEGLQIFDF
jgi:hypothetical protein